MAKQPIKTTAVQNFVGSLEGLTFEQALGNLEMDANSYKWNRATVAAIRSGISAHFFPKKTAKKKA